MVRSAMVTAAAPAVWALLLVGHWSMPAHAAKRGTRFDARIAIFVTAQVPAQERNAALAKGILRELAAYLPRYSYLAGKPLKRKLRGDPDATIKRCEGSVECLAKLGRRLRVAEVLLGDVTVQANGAVLRVKVVDATRGKLVRQVDVPIPSEDALRPGLKVRAAALFGVKPVGRVVIPGNSGQVVAAGKVIGTGPGPFDLPPGPIQLSVSGITYEVEVEAFERTRVDTQVEEPPLLGLESVEEPELFVPPLAEGPEDTETTEAAETREQSVESVPTSTGAEKVAVAPSNPVMDKSIEEIMAAMPGEVTVEGPLDQVVVERGPTALTWAGVATGGVGVVLLGAGVYFGLERQAAQNDLDSLKRGPDGDTQLEAERIEKEGDDAARRATIAFAAGGALVAVGATLVAIDLWPDSDGRAAIWFDETGAMASFAWSW